MDKDLKDTLFKKLETKGVKRDSMTYNILADDLKFNPNKIGYRLAKISLLIALIFLIYLIYSINNFKGLDINPEIFESLSRIDSCGIDKNQFIESYFEERNQERDFLTGLIQLVLVNFLLPIVTAILGYILGKTSIKND